MSKRKTEKTARKDARLDQKTDLFTTANAEDQHAEETIDTLIAAFEKVAYMTEDGAEFWFARDLMKIFQYTNWRNFRLAIEKAYAACKIAGNDPDAHFLTGDGERGWRPEEILKTSLDYSHLEKTKKSFYGSINAPVMRPSEDNFSQSAGNSGRKHRSEDVILDRYAAYLTAENADSSKRPVAFAQTYFAIQTRRQELRDEAERRLAYDEKRVLLRDRLKEHNKSLNAAARDAGVKTQTEFRNFNGSGLRALYGMNKAQLLRYKGLADDDDHLDHAGHEEVAANYFKATQAEARLRREGVTNAPEANKTHEVVGAAIRKTIADLGGTMPEDLPPEENIQKTRKRVKATEQKTKNLPKPKDES